MVGRAEELTRLHHLLEQARAGTRQVVFVAGEPGIGKTALVEAFVAEIERQPHLWTAYGQCIEHYGGGEPYLPFLEALEQSVPSAWPCASPPVATALCPPVARAAAGLPDC